MVIRERTSNQPHSSDADSDILADFVLALVRTEDPDEQVKSNCLENLEDFLRDRDYPHSSLAGVRS